MEKKNNGIVGKILVIILLIAALAGGFFFGNYYTEETKTITNASKKETNKEQEEDTTEKLDINSRLVKFLYGEVTNDQKEPSNYFGWEFNNYLGNNMGDTSDFYADKADELYKMIFVGRNLSDYNLKYAYDMNIPKSNDGSYVKENDKRYYTKDYIEYVYKLLFGKDAKLDTSVPIHIGVYGGENYIYDENTNNYFKYHADVGGTTGPGGYTANLSKAIKNGNKIELYQDVKLIDADNTTVREQFQYIYTFELENDGMYKFVSRTKK